MPGVGTVPVPADERRYVFWIASRRVLGALGRGRAGDSVSRRPATRRRRRRRDPDLGFGGRPPVLQGRVPGVGELGSQSRRHTAARRRQCR